MDQNLTEDQAIALAETQTDLELEPEDELDA